jgi:ankyrin repeat protein
VRDYGDPLCFCYDYNVAKMLIKHGAGPNSYVGDDQMPTLLHYLTSHVRMETLKAVLESGGAAVNIPNEKGRTAMFNASSPQIVDLLFNAGFSVEWEDLEGFRPLHAIVSREESLSTVKAMLVTRCDVNAKDKKGRTPLHIICLQGISDVRSNMSQKLRNRLNTIKLLADFGANIGTVDNEGKTPLELLLIPPHEETFAEWKAIKDYLEELLDAQVNHGFKMSRVDMEEETNTDED